MATVIDSLIVSLGLDSKQFNAGQKQMVRDLRGASAAADASAKQIMESGKKAAEFFGEIRSQALGLFAVFTAGKGIKEFAGYVTTTDAAMGRLATNIGMSTQELTAWRGIAERTGGSAEGMTGTIKALAAQMQELNTTGKMAAFDPLSRAGVDMGKFTAQTTTATERMLLLADAFSKLDPAKRQYLGQAAGYDEQTINLLGQGRQALIGLLAEQKKIGAASEADAKAAQELQSAWIGLVQSGEQLGRMMMRDLNPHLLEMIGHLKELAEWGKENIGTVEKIAAAIAIISGVGTAKVAAKILGGAGAAAGSAVGGASGLAGKMLRLGVRGTGLGALGMMIGDSTAANSDEDKILAGMSDAQKRAAVGNTGISSSVAAARNKSYPERERTAMAYFMARGWSEPQAAGIVANLKRESAFDAQAVGDNGKAYGIAQWHPDRQETFKKQFGKDITKSSFDEQMAFVDWELRNSEAKAGRLLKMQIDKRGAGAAVSRYYERPGVTEEDRAREAQERARMADAISLNAGASLTAGTRAFTNNMASTVNIGSLTVQTQATDAEGIAKDFGPALERQGVGVNADRGVRP